MKTLLALVLFLAPAARAAEGWEAGSRLPAVLDKPLPDDPMQVTVHRLSNGLTVYLSPNKQVPRITARIVTRAGGAQDPQDSTGMAHYLEHMLFKGSQRLGTLDWEKEKPLLERISALYERLFTETDPEVRKKTYAEIDAVNQEASKYASPNELDKAYKTLGVVAVNAHTSNEETVYECDMPKNRLEAWARIEGDRFKAPVFRLFQSELEAVYEEKNRSLDNPGTLVWEALEKAMFKGHPYAVPVIGSIEHLKNPSLAKMYAFYDANYRPNNMAVVLAGDFEPEKALALIGERFGGWEPKALPERAKVPIAALTAPERLEVRYEAEEQGMVVWPLVPNGHPDEDALTVMDMVASNSESGLIDLRLNQAQKVKSSGSSPEFRNEAGMWLTWFLPKEGQTLEAAEALMMETVEALKKGEFSEDDLKAIVLNFEIGEKYKLESNDARVGSMVAAFTEFEDWAHRAARLKRLRAVTKADVVRVANQYLGEGRVVAFRRKGKPEIPAITKPGFTKVTIEPGRQSPFFKEVIAIPAAPIEPKWVVKGEDYLEKKTPAGKLVWVKNPVNDLFALSFNFERGSLHERTLCAALGLFDKAGAGEVSAEALKKRLYGLGIKMDAWCGEQGSGASLSGPEENLEAGLKLLKERFAAPNLAPGTLERMVEIWVGQHKDNKVEPDAIDGALTAWAERGADSPVLHELTDPELKALKEADLRKLLAGFFDWERRVTYVGTRGADSIAALLAEPGKAYKPKPARRPVAYVKPAAARVVFTHRDMVQSKVGLYAADGVYDPVHATDYRFYSNYMGGGMSSVVFQEVREARSLAYSAWGGYAPGGEKGDENRVVGRLGCQADKTIEAVDLIERLLKEPPPADARFKETKESILQTYRTDPLTFREVPGAVLGWEDLGFDKDPRPKRFAEAQDYTLDMLVRFAARFKDKAMSIHILGNRERVDLKALAKFGAFVEKKVDELFPY